MKIRGFIGRLLGAFALPVIAEEVAANTTQEISWEVAKTKYDIRLLPEDDKYRKHIEKYAIHGWTGWNWHLFVEKTQNGSHHFAIVDAYVKTHLDNNDAEMYLSQKMHCIFVFNKGETRPYAFFMSDPLCTDNFDALKWDLNTVKINCVKIIP